MEYLLGYHGIIQGYGDVPTGYWDIPKWLFYKMHLVREYGVDLILEVLRYYSYHYDDDDDEDEDDDDGIHGIMIIMGMII